MNLYKKDLNCKRFSRFRAGEDGSGKKPVTYTQVYVPSLKQSGWINSDCIG